MPSDEDPIELALRVADRQDATRQVFASDHDVLRHGVRAAAHELYTLRAQLAAISQLPADACERLQGVCMDITNAGRGPRDRVVVMEKPLILLGGFVYGDGRREAVAALAVSYGFGPTPDAALRVLEEDVRGRFCRAAGGELCS